MAETKETDRKKCFAIMPWTTPVTEYKNYPAKKDHFRLVYNHIFKPAIEMAGFNPEPPIAEGTININSRIIEKLEEADLVLFDMSIFNPNAFYEAGIRTALNKPICIIKDHFILDNEIPFDHRSINIHTYNPSLFPEEIPETIKDLAAFIKKTPKNADNSIWRTYGFRYEGKRIEVTEDQEFISKEIINKLNEFGSELDYIKRIISYRDKERYDYGPKGYTGNSLNEPAHFDFSKIDMVYHKFLKDIPPEFWDEVRVLEDLGETREGKKLLKLGFFNNTTTDVKNEVVHILSKKYSIHVDY